MGRREEGELRGRGREGGRRATEKVGSGGETARLGMQAAPCLTSSLTRLIDSREQSPTVTQALRDELLNVKRVSPTSVNTSTYGQVGSPRQCKSNLIEALHSRTRKTRHKNRRNLARPSFLVPVGTKAK